MSASKVLLGDLLAPSGQHRAGKNDYPVLSITMKQGLVDQADKFKKRVASQDTSNYRVAYHNELVVGFPIDEGVLGFQTKYPAAIVSPAYDIWSLKNAADCHIPYLERYLRSTQARHLYASRMQGAVARRRSLTKADFLALEIPFPPLQDQIRIAFLLGNVEGLIAQRKQQLQQLDDLLKSVFLEMFGDPVRNERGWQKSAIGTFTTVGTGATPSRQSSERYYGGEIPWVKTTEVQNRDIWETEEHVTDLAVRETNCSVYTPGTILLAMYGQGKTRGQVGLLRISAATNQACAAIVPSEHNEIFVYEQLKYLYRSIRNLGRGGNQENLNLSLVRGIELILPSRDLQDQFAAIVGKVEALKSRYQKSLSELETLCSALSQQAFKGKLDLSRVPLPDAEPVEPETAIPAIGSSLADAPNAIDLPDTELLLAALEDRTRLGELLPFWLDAYRIQTSGAAFSAQDFLSAAQTRIAELHPDSDFELGTNAYEQVKAWVFDALADGRLTQGYADADNRVRLASQSANWGTW